MIYTAYISQTDKDLCLLYKKVGKIKFRKLMRLSLLSLQDPSRRLELTQCYEFDQNIPTDYIYENAVRICMDGQKWASVRSLMDKITDKRSTSSFMKTVFRMVLGPKILMPLFLEDESVMLRDTQSLSIEGAVAPVKRQARKTSAKKATRKPQKVTASHAASPTTPVMTETDEKPPLKITVLPEKPVEKANPSYQTFSMEDEFKSQEEKPQDDILSMLNNLFG